MLHTTYTRALAATFVTLLALGCGDPDVSKVYGDVQGLAKDMHSQDVGVYEKAVKVAEDVTFVAVEAPVVDLGAANVETACALRYLIGKEGGDGAGFVPGRHFPCDDEEAVAEARKKAGEWLEYSLGLNRDEMDVRLARIDAIRSVTDTISDLTARTTLDKVPFDLSRCFDQRLELFADDVAERAALNCQASVSPGHRLDTLRREIDAAAEAARNEIETSKIRPSWRVMGAVAEACNSVAAADPANEGVTTGRATGTRLAFGTTVYAGEQIEIIARSQEMDPALELWDAGCTKRLRYDDDSGRGDTAWIRHWAGADEGLVIVLRSSRGEPSGEYALTLGFKEGPPTITKERKAHLLEFDAWAKAVPDPDLQLLWQTRAPHATKVACLEAHVLSTRAAAKLAARSQALESCVEDLSTLGDEANGAGKVDLGALLKDALRGAFDD